MTNTDNVWIELVPAQNDEEGERRAAKMSAMIERLGGPPDSIIYKRPYYHHMTIDGFTASKDHGVWFNLDFFGRDDDA